MGLESSQERSEQEQPRSTTSAEADHSPAVKGNSVGEQFPANVTPAPVPPDPDELVALLQSWIRIPDWFTSKTYLQTHPELLTEAAAQVLATLTQNQRDQQVHELLMLHQQLLQIAGQQGVEAAYQALLYQEEKNDSAASEQEELQAQVIAWLQTPDWETSQTYLQTHPNLLTDAAEHMLEELKRAQEDEQAQAMINLHQILLQKARVEGIEAAYKRFLVPEPETPLSDQEGETSQDLQDPITLNDEAMDAFLLYRAGGQIADLNRALECWHEALNLTLPDSPDRPTLLGNLGAALGDRYARTGQLADLEAAITASQQALQATPPDAPGRPTLLFNLGSELIDHYARTGQLADLQAAITAYQQALQALQAIPLSSPDRPMLLNSLRSRLSWLHNRYVRTGQLADLEAAITASQQALQAIPLSSPDRPNWLNNLGAALRDRYVRTGQLADLEAAITAYQQALQATPPDSPDRPALLGNLGTGLIDRYARTGQLADLEAAITASQQALQATPPDSPDRPGLLINLGSGLHDRYARTGQLADLEAAITAYQQAVQATPSNSPERPRHLNNLGRGLLARYTHTGQLADLEAAITASQQAVQATPPDSPDRPARLNSLGNSLNNHYQRTGELADLEAAITASQQALQATPLDSPDRPSRLGNLGNALRERYARTGELADLEAAITASQQALQATPADSPDRHSHLGILGTALHDRYAHTGQLADLEAAITAYQQALQATPPDSPDRPIWLNNLGTGLTDRYERSGDLADLEAAITAFQQALQATSPDSPGRPARLNNLGSGLRDRYERTGDLADLEAAITAWETSWSVLSLHFAALPVVYKLGQQRQEGGISGNLVTAYLERAAQRRPSTHADQRSALIVAEGNKSRLLTQLVGRGLLPLPTGLSPQIAEREQHLLAALTALDTQELAAYGHSATARDETSRLNRLQQRQADLSELENLWTSIARLGSEDMEYVALRRGEAPTWQDLSHLAKKLGPNTALLSFFTTTDHALLFLLRAGWRMPRVVETPLNRAGWDDLLERFFREVHRYGPGLRRSETWDLPLRPLFTRAQHHLEGVERLILAPAANGHLLPWGVLAERAGWHTSSGQRLPLVTLPALGILPRLRQRQHVPPGPSLVIGNPLGDLPYAEVEANAVAERFRTKPLLGAAATKSAVLSRLPEATLIHLATHAFFDPDNPLESGIVLADGVLTAREVLQHRLQADLLVLSACESGQVGSLGGEELAGLSQAFLQTGVRSLLVSLWRVNDPATAAFIQAFYTARQVGADKALALRQAMTQIQQDQRWTHPYYWGAFVLLGDWD